MDIIIRFVPKPNVSIIIQNVSSPFFVFCFVCLFVGDLMICVSNRYRRILNV